MAPAAESPVVIRNRLRLMLIVAPFVFLFRLLVKLGVTRTLNALLMWLSKSLARAGKQRLRFVRLLE
jgi:hypothetical protein